MKIKNLTVKRKVKKKGLINKELKIKKFYTKFKAIIFNNIKKQSFAI